jgi:hypothetical protein
VGIAVADDSASHAVQINVANIDDVNVTGGDVTLDPKKAQLN